MKNKAFQVLTAIAVIFVLTFGVNAYWDQRDLGGAINAYEWRAVGNETINTTNTQTYYIGWNGLKQVGKFQYSAASDDSNDTVFVTLQSRITDEFAWVTERIDTLVGTSATTEFTATPDFPSLRWSVVAQDTTVVDLGVSFERRVFSGQ